MTYNDSYKNFGAPVIGKDTRARNMHVVKYAVDCESLFFILAWML